MEADYAAALGTIPNGRAKTRGIEVGRAAAAAILALRAADGADTPLMDHRSTRRARPPASTATHPAPRSSSRRAGRDVTPFVLRDSSQFRPGPPYAVTSRKYTADFNEVKRLGGDDITTPSARTAEQTEIALFWAESSPLQWNRIARAVSAEGLDLWEQARVFGLLNMALTDGYIGSWETKYHYHYWRPVTAIRTADIDGNPNTSADPTWTPLVDDPPDPGLRLRAQRRRGSGGPGPQALLRHRQHQLCDLQPDAAARETCSDPTPDLRRYTSFSQAAEENAVSRIHDGFHFREAVERESSTARRSATEPSANSCGRQTES